MKLVLPFLLAAATLVVGITAAKAEPENYPLKCKVGSAMVVKFPGGNIVNVKFTPAPTPASPGRGQCVWLDRTLNGGEPAMIQAEGDFAQELLEKMLNGGTFTIPVYNDGEGHMIMTAGG